jgi:hypothetical protein
MILRERTFYLNFYRYLRFECLCVCVLDESDELVMVCECWCMRVQHNGIPDGVTSTRRQRGKSRTGDLPAMGRTLACGWIVVNVLSVQTSRCGIAIASTRWRSWVAPDPLAWCEARSPVVRPLHDGSGPRVSLAGPLVHRDLPLDAAPRRRC